ncbi:MAG TPA: sigma-70 family RNA polymerase sigma factor [Aggregatilineaceae bacterium]|nr:sigma-70 family RNA polymerase sigma factor [Aggregatilineaceae bacterium]
MAITDTDQTTTNTDSWHQLLALGERQGYVTYDDILAQLPAVEQNIELLEEMLDALSSAGVEVMAAPPAELPKHPATASAAPVEEALETLDFQDLMKDAGYQQALDTDDVVGLYLKEAGRVPLLTAEEEVALAKRMEAAKFATEQIKLYRRNLSSDEISELEALIEDGKAAQEHLVRANSRLVISVAKKYIGRGVPFLDLIQEGNIGLIRAARKFEYQRGHKFSTYATWWIRQAVSRAVADQGRTIRVPVHMGDQINRLRRVSTQLTQEFGREPTTEEMANAMETTPDKVMNLIEISRRPISLETPIEEDADSEFGDFIEDKSSPEPNEVVTQNLLREHLAQVLARLPERESHILKLRYGLLDGETHTLEEVGKKIGVTRERVRQLEAQALNRLRHSSAHQLLQDYLLEA